MSGPLVGEGRYTFAVAHLAYARTQNSGTGILGLLNTGKLSLLWQLLFCCIRKLLVSHTEKRSAGCAQMRDVNSRFTASIWRTKCCKPLRVEGKVRKQIDLHDVSGAPACILFPFFVYLKKCVFVPSETGLRQGVM